MDNLWGKPALNSGGGLWDPPTFDAQGNIYLGIANPGPITYPASYPWATSRPGPDLYTDSVVKLSPQGKLLWYYQLTPHDLYDWDLQDSPVLTTAHGQPVVVDGGKAGIMIELNAQTGKLLWRLPVGQHSGHDNDGLRNENATPTSHINLPAKFCLEPGPFGGIETQLASNGSTTFAAVNNLPVLMTKAHGYDESSAVFQAAINKGTGEMVAVNQDTGKVEWDDKLPSSPYGAAAVTNDVVFTTTWHGDLYALDTATGALLHTVRAAEPDEHAGHHRRRLRDHRGQRGELGHAARADHRVQTGRHRQAPAPSHRPAPRLTIPAGTQADLPPQTPARSGQTTQTAARPGW